MAESKVKRTVWEIITINERKFFAMSLLAKGMNCT